MFGMAFKEIVSQLMANREPPESAAWIAGAVHDPEDIPDPHQAPGDTGVQRLILLVNDPFRICDLEGIYRQLRDVVLPEDIRGTGFCFPPGVNEHVSPFWSGLIFERAWLQTK